jgi:hypothetical protein
MGIRTATPKQVSQTRQPPRRAFNPWLKRSHGICDFPQLRVSHLSLTAASDEILLLHPSIWTTLDLFFLSTPPTDWTTAFCALAYLQLLTPRHNSERPTRNSSPDRKGDCDLAKYITSRKINATADSNQSDRKLLSHLPKDISYALGSSSPFAWAQRTSAIPSVMMTCNSPDGPGSRRIVLTYTSGSLR